MYVCVYVCVCCVCVMCVLCVCSVLDAGTLNTPQCTRSLCHRLIGRSVGRYVGPLSIDQYRLCMSARVCVCVCVCLFL
jgi:hypothetical protein